MLYLSASISRSFTMLMLSKLVGLQPLLGSRGCIKQRATAHASTSLRPSNLHLQRNMHGKSCSRVAAGQGLEGLCEHGIMQCIRHSATAHASTHCACTGAQPRQPLPEQLPEQLPEADRFEKDSRRAAVPQWGTALHQAHRNGPRLDFTAILNLHPYPDVYG
jgi:hypothetical protein